MPRVVPMARMRDHTAGLGMDQPNCTPECLNRRGVREWNATLMKPLRWGIKCQHCVEQGGVFRGVSHHWLMSNKHHAKALNGSPTAEAREFRMGI